MKVTMTVYNDDGTESIEEVGVTVVNSPEDLTMLLGTEPASAD